MISTTAGIKMINEELLIPGTGILYEFFDDLAIPAHTVEIKPVEILHFDGQALSDIRSTGENEAAREFIVRYVAKETRRESIRIFASIAGGRKTMSAYLSLAMNLYGRRQDHLSHVLVSPSEQELDRRFFYPNPDDRQITLQSGQTMLARDVKIDLADIPFIQLRPMLENYYRDEFQNIETLFQISQDTINSLGQDVKMIFNRRTLTLQVFPGQNNPWISIPLPPKEAAIYLLTFESEKPVALQHEEKRLDALYQQLKTREFEAKPDWSQEHIQKKISNLNSLLRQQSPTYLYHQIKLDKTTSGYPTHYFIPLPKAARQLIDE
jgi:CRISPR-associated protein (TIGR02584 family)